MTLDELDRLAAEKVMGWIPYGKLYFYVGVGLDSKKIDQRQDEWQPTRNIAQAWQLLEKIQAMNILPGISTLPSRNIWAVYLSENGRPANFVSAEATTAPEAITRACLKASGVILDECDTSK